MSVFHKDREWWTKFRDDANVMTEHSAVLGGVLCRWWGDDEPPPGVHVIAELLKIPAIKREDPEKLITAFLKRYDEVFPFVETDRQIAQVHGIEWPGPDFNWSKELAALRDFVGEKEDHDGKIPA